MSSGVLDSSTRWERRKGSPKASLWVNLHTSPPMPEGVTRPQSNGAALQPFGSFLSLS